ncbi:class I SAM-dependent methyltransferase [uncultured Microbacterium sp.]|uniref:class I SAM-dependent methyltransferase n=1 Tax=uncultured Microbacterium sp. TaxID=191216 RepID=UPI0025F36FA5|nr:class I SAM-dependent methyltransferase [uncultured Microbacterium sp.]
MELAELQLLLTPEGLGLLDRVGAVSSTDDVARAVTTLRSEGYSPDLVAAVVTQARLRTRGEAKFGELAKRMLLTRAGLEQATRLPVAARHAARFREAGLGTGERSIVDLGSGIGGDALGFAGLGLRVHAVDVDEVTAAICAFNLAPFGESATVERAAAEDVDLDRFDAAWLDPARRSAGHGETNRTFDPAEFTPRLDWAFSIGERMPVGIKLGPGLPHDALPSGERVEAQWITVGQTTIELVVWLGALARPGVGRSALVLGADGAHELTARSAVADEPRHPLGSFVHEPAGSIIRAQLVGAVARELDAGPVADGIAYLTSDADRRSPFAQTFRVREVLPADTRKLGAALRERRIGTLEIKKRGVDVDPQKLRPQLKLRGDESATLLMTRIDGARVAILADRV